MENIIINGIKYTINSDEFVVKPHSEYNNLKIYPKVGELERIIGLLNDLTEKNKDTTISFYGWKYGGFVPIGCSKVYKKVFVYTKDIITGENIPDNIKVNIKNENPFVVCAIDEDIELSLFKNSYILCRKDNELVLNGFSRFPLYDTDIILYVPTSRLNEFKSEFHYYIEDNNFFKYDNLIHLCIMVKNAGPLFEKVLTENLPIIDRWTILDTGSTDGTQDIIRKVLVGKKKGELYEEPFINFRDSRNRCLDLAGKHCKYLLMLDDTYVIKNNLREFLNVVRGDQFATSYSLLILSDDTEYYSNRVTMSERGLRYVYTIHEVIQHENNKQNVVIPKEASYIYDYRADYMEKRTMDRKRYDLQLLHDMVRDDPKNPRHYYYLAQTYNLLEDYENALFWFKKRATTELEGHKQEAVDSWFEYARIKNFKLNHPWEECLAAYEECFNMDQSRPEALYFIGIHHYLKGDKNTSYNYFKHAFALGYPIHAQFSLKPTLVFHFLPKFLCELCYYHKDWELGFESSKRFLLNNKPDTDSYTTILSWYKIYELLVKLPKETQIYSISEKPLVVFVADGGWGPWTGSDILTKGVGGSETYIIEIARWIQASEKFQCIVFCNCSKSEIFEGVKYMDLKDYPKYIKNNLINTIIISRYSEYVPISYESSADNIYLVLHDLGPSGDIIPYDFNKFRKVLCLTNWHKDLFTSQFSLFKNNTDSFYYGIDTNRFKPSKKVKNSFIYSSFPNRGLLPLLKMWPKIIKAIPDATLNIYSDINGKWVNEVAKEQMDEIHKIIEEKMEGVTIHGWVSKDDLAIAWSKADIWLYPCIFKETFCLTALEAAATKTLAIGPPLAALAETIGNRGIIIEGDPMDISWQDKALNEILSILENPEKKEELIEKNYQWSQTISWKQRGEEFINKYLQIEDINNSGMKNWSHDLPVGGQNKEKFLRALSIVNPKHILEIGTFTGISLIEMLKLYPEAKGTAIDKWDNYNEDNLSLFNSIKEKNIENIFYNNIKNAGLTERVTGIKGDSVDKLCELIEAGKQFDFIYVDGSHKCLDCYTDMVLAWQLLRVGGILAVDDILYKINKVLGGDLLGYPLKAKEHFMEKYKGQYEVISDSYRLFIKKL
jgi:predicted O-methyltransferase YrrM